MTKQTYTASNSTTLSKYEKDGNIRGASVIVDRSVVFSAIPYGSTKPSALSYYIQIRNFKEGRVRERHNTNDLLHGQCTPEGWYWVTYKATFNRGTKNTPKCDLDAFKR